MVTCIVWYTRMVASFFINFLHLWISQTQFQWGRGKPRPARGWTRPRRGPLQDQEGRRRHGSHVSEARGVWNIVRLRNHWTAFISNLMHKFNHLLELKRVLKNSSRYSRVHLTILKVLPSFGIGSWKVSGYSKGTVCFWGSVYISFLTGTKNKWKYISCFNSLLHHLTLNSGYTNNLTEGSM